jgi:hypothetical protein
MQYWFADFFRNPELNDPPTVEDLVDVEMNGQTRVKTTAEWYPYPTKMVSFLAN